MNFKNIILFIFLSYFVFAITSENYEIKPFVINNAGNTLSNTNYDMLTSFGESFIGITSNLYELHAGFINLLPISYDTTPPTKPIVVDEGDFTSSTTQLAASWISIDPESRIIDNQYAIGTVGNGTIDKWYESAPLGSGWANHVMIFANGYIFAILGTNVLGAVQDDKTGSITGWGFQTPLPSSRSLMAGVGWKWRMYILGGYTGTEVTDTVFTRIAAPSHEWQIANPMPERLAEHSAALDEVNGRIYISGGYNNSYITQNKIYIGKINLDTGEITWATASQTLPQPIKGHTSIVYNSHLYIIGGYDGTFRNKVIVYPILANGDLGEPKEVNPLPESRAYHSSVIARGNVYVIGGAIEKTNGVINSSSVFMAELYQDGSLGKWQILPSLPQAVRRGASVFDPRYNIIFFSGGLGNDEGKVYQGRVNKASQDIVGFTSIGTSQNVVHTGLNLIEGQKYYFTVRTKNEIGLWSEEGHSDGIIVESGNPPSITSVRADPLTYNPTRGESTNLIYTLSEPAFVSIVITGTGITPITLVSNEYRKAGANAEVVKGIGLPAYGTFNFTITAKDIGGNTSTATGVFYTSSSDTPVISDVIDSPDPFSQTTTISYTLRCTPSITTKVIINIFDTSGPVGDGKIVRHLIDEIQTYGGHHVEWDGKNDEGFNVEYGVYRYDITPVSYSESITLIGNTKSGTITFYPSNYQVRTFDEITVKYFTEPVSPLQIEKYPTLPEPVQYALKVAQENGQILVSPIYEIKGGPFYPQAIFSFSYDPQFFGKDVAIFKFNPSTNLFDIIIPNQVVDIANNQILAKVVDFESLYAIFRFTDKDAPTITNVECVPFMFSPNNDGVKDITYISYTISDNFGFPLMINVAIYDEVNRLIKVIYDGEQEQGTHIMTWDGKDKFGNIVSEGSYIVQIIAKDKVENQSKVTKRVIVDITPPVITKIEATPSILWPPNHKLVPVEFNVQVQDNFDTNPKIKLISVISNQPDEINAGGDGHTINDIQDAQIGEADTQILLRAERMGKINRDSSALPQNDTPRIYTITYQACDEAGNRSNLANVEVIAPHDKGVDSSELTDDRKTKNNVVAEQNFARKNKEAEPRLFPEFKLTEERPKYEEKMKEQLEKFIQRHEEIKQKYFEVQEKLNNNNKEKFKLTDSSLFPKNNNNGKAEIKYLNIIDPNTGELIWTSIKCNSSNAGIKDMRNEIKNDPTLKDLIKEHNKNWARFINNGGKKFLEQNSSQLRVDSIQKEKENQWNKEDNGNNKQREENNNNYNNQEERKENNNQGNNRQNQENDKNQGNQNNGEEHGNQNNNQKDNKQGNQGNEHKKK